MMRRFSYNMNAESDAVSVVRLEFGVQSPRVPVYIEVARERCRVHTFYSPPSLYAAEPIHNQSHILKYTTNT